MNQILRRLAFCGRFSSVNQRCESIDDQFRNIRQHLDRLDIPHDDALLIKDEAVSGAGVMGPECKKLMKMIDRGEIHTLAVDDLSRLSRRADLPMIWEKCRARRCRVISVIDNLDSQRDPEGVVAWVKGMMNHLGNKNHGARCRRSLVGRVLDPIGADGSHPFGYATRFCDPEAAAKYCGNGPKPKREIFIHEPEAAVVREIFRMYADGMSTREIARELNRRGIHPGRRSASGQKVGENAGWRHHRIDKMLRKKKYFGYKIWGEQVYTKDENGNRVVHQSDPADRIEVESPTLAIIDRPLWDRVQARLAKFQEKYGSRPDQKRRGRQHHYVDDYPTRILSGLLYCGECGTRLHFAMSGNRRAAYRCPLAQRHGKNADGKTCTQHGTTRIDRAEKALLDYLRDALLAAPEWLDAVYEQAEATYRLQIAQTPDRLSELTTKWAAAVQAREGLLKTIEAGNGAAPASLMERYQQREREVVALDREIETLQTLNSRVDNLPAKAEVGRQLMGMAAILGEEPRKTSKLLRRFCGRIHVHQILQPGKKRGYMELRFRFNPDAALTDDLPDDDEADTEMTGLAVTQPREVPVAESPASSEGRLVTLPLGEPSRLDKLMPEIQHLIEQEGWSWKRIAKHFYINAAWAAEYYRRRKNLI